jgi:inward rectifier potassium channel
MFRTANKRKNYILEAQLWVTLVRDEHSIEGDFMRRFHDIQLVRSHTPVFSLSWTAMHQILPSGLLDGDTVETLRRDRAEIIVTFTGLDETLAQTIHARHTFSADDIHWNHRFADILLTRANGRRVIDFNKFNMIHPVSRARHLPSHSGSHSGSHPGSHSGPGHPESGHQSISQNTAQGMSQQHLSNGFHQGSSPIRSAPIDENLN